MYDLGKGSTGAALEAANAQRLQTALPVLHCPSRRGPVLVPVPPGIWFVERPVLCAPLTMSARTDYAVNGGEVFISVGTGPSTLAEGDGGTFPFPNWYAATGVSHTRSRVTCAMLTDGTSNTYLLGEKSLARPLYAAGTSIGDDQGPYVSDDLDSMRWGAHANGADLPPMRDAAEDRYPAFGAPHISGFQMAFADGSVRSISYTISIRLHRSQCNRWDGEVVPE